jgi:hypothetical protein
MKYLKHKILMYLENKGYILKKKSYFDKLEKIPSLNKKHK